MVIFKPTTLYVKKHIKTGLKYFGKTNKLDRSRYNGSGTYWSNHIKKYGVEFVIELWSKNFTDETECTEFAKAVSELFDVVNSKEWANQIVEDGLSGNPSGFFHSELTKQKISATLKGRSSPKSKFVIKEDAGARSRRIGEYNKGRCWITNGIINQKTFIIDNNIPDGWWFGKTSRTPTSATCIYCKRTMHQYHITRYHNNNCKVKPLYV
jgi:hypothetical protein